MPLFFEKPFTNGPSCTRASRMNSSGASGGGPFPPFKPNMNTKLKVERVRFITRECVRANPDKIFLFGDNLEQRGFGGQAAAMRGEPNAVGIPTKKSPSHSRDAFFTDDELEQNKSAIDLAFATLAGAVSDSTRSIIVPSCGLGTGRAQLKERAPRTFAHLQRRLEELL